VRAALEEQGDSPVLSFDELRQDASSRLKAMARIVVADESRSNTLMALAKGHLPNEAYREFPPRDEVRFIPAPVLSFCIPPNPALARLRQHAELCLAKIRACKNMAGLDLCLDPYAGSTMDLSGADFGQMPSLLASGLQPLPYHYSTLIERTKQLVELARQMESSMLQFISSTEQAQYEELKARQDLELTQAGVQLKQLQVLQASDSVTSANLQRDRAQLQSSHFTELLSNGWTVNEQLQVTNLAVATVHQHAAAIASWVGIWFGTSNAANAIGTSGAAWSMNSQFHGLLASFERRAQEWQFERTLAEQDVRVGEQQITVARDQFAIANQERAIAALQAGHAQTVVNFLTGKFLNADLYEWMADVMGQVYRFFLQQATQLARLA
jgi:Tc toxin complex TcA C-terminal TcB-binding domain